MKLGLVIRLIAAKRQLRNSDNSVERRPDIMAHPRKKIRLCPVSGHKHPVRLLHPPPVDDDHDKHDARDEKHNPIKPNFIRIPEIAEICSGRDVDQVHHVDLVHLTLRNTQDRFI